ncbi:unnamed protein product [Peronospora belbahrii]|uniref:Uncharacterized protein n=1 Tax=Peronospora belbahrii TaxID=622444 RepID=A0AAU9L6H6_9STRA|nr:unnamed protein product [Peronospora belbahrii]
MKFTALAVAAALATTYVVATDKPALRALAGTDADEVDLNANEDMEPSTESDDQQENGWGWGRRGKWGHGHGGWGHGGWGHGGWGHRGHRGW